VLLFVLRHRDKTGKHPLTFEIDTAGPGERQTVPVALKLEAPGLLQGPLAAKARVSGSTARS
jgi:hypothetical protein